MASSGARRNSLWGRREGGRMSWAGTTKMYYLWYHISVVTTEHIFDEKRCFQKAWLNYLLCWRSSKLNKKGPRGRHILHRPTCARHWISHYASLCMYNIHCIYRQFRVKVGAANFIEFPAVSICFFFFHTCTWTRKRSSCAVCHYYYVNKIVECYDGDLCCVHILYILIHCNVRTATPVWSGCVIHCERFTTTTSCLSGNFIRCYERNIIIIWPSCSTFEDHQYIDVYSFTYSILIHMDYDDGYSAKRPEQ